MKNIKNKFGEGLLYDETDLGNKIYVKCCACMSVYSDFLSWANSHIDKIVKTPEESDCVVVLSCQVTDLAILNDLKNAEYLYKKYNKTTYIGGCLAQRFDINFSDNLKRLDVVRDTEQEIIHNDLIDYAKPFWIKDFTENKEELSQGNIFRNMYPLKIGAGCHGLCKYCTIRHTRGTPYYKNPYDQVHEFMTHDNVVLISDSPTVKQIMDWCDISMMYMKPISIRNIEPQVAMTCIDKLLELAKLGLLHILHSPIQSNSEEVLMAMNRSVKPTLDFIEQSKVFRSLGVVVATNIIIDYKVNGKVISNHDVDFMKNNFDYYSWNPYWDGVWNRELAKQRFQEYIQ